MCILCYIKNEILNLAKVKVHEINMYPYKNLTISYILRIMHLRTM